ncbi:toll/interleukin-1 receptor domain-containing protein [Vibrio cholerae]|uniref:Toll-Interleukin receptor n=1 Tax=Vibrio metoecus TaxID=1481663 RepID=A0ABR4RUY5_VIBMT|nr:toll/interleukin-1 receptor domain-containing protein [Vibrio cholerae]KDO13046.1 toll-Interleukin receptor [Vibrio metoecus]EJK2108241.1 toll/interleukin-1 receptor domain-containing protein [Vibrio cholerae]EJL6781016.1 toll/interleukin-1 receptor domain-containing protein [Vibrio cholerae]EJL6985904.1 toll/interleukin-1 receptor domain-containing protein [Vibrio cholerae]EKF9197544.1 toll/interleukin-1 receptor domain-containing protein [Vibrio cholerae]
MNIFISWSGNRSKAVAELLDEWLQCVIQAVDPWMSSKDIDRGALWFSEINDQLQNTTIGIICLTQENLNKPWILFEAGALAKGLTESRVCTFLIDVQPTDIGTPLSQFNHTFPDKEGLWELVRTLNSSLKEKSLKEKILEQVFDTYWPQFEVQFASILQKHPVGEQVQKREENDILLEILSSTRSMERRVRDLERGTSRVNKKVPLPLFKQCVNESCNTMVLVDDIDSVEKVFGFRHMANGMTRPQSYCKECRSNVEGATS